MLEIKFFGLEEPLVTRVETRVETVISLVSTDKDGQERRVCDYDILQLPPITTRGQNKKDIKLDDKNCLTLKTKVVDANGDLAKPCNQCIEREFKKLERTKSTHGDLEKNMSNTMLLLHSNPYVEFSSGAASLPFRIICYNRHQSPQSQSCEGFCLVVKAHDSSGKVIAKGTSPLINTSDAKWVRRGLGQSGLKCSEVIKFIPANKTKNSQSAPPKPKTKSMPLACITNTVGKRMSEARVQDGSNKKPALNANPQKSAPEPTITTPLTSFDNEYDKEKPDSDFTIISYSNTTAIGKRKRDDQVQQQRNKHLTLDLDIDHNIDTSLRYTNQQVQESVPEFTFDTVPPTPSFSSSSNNEETLGPFSTRFTDEPPTIESIFPNSGPIQGGTLVDIFGQNFHNNVLVKFGEHDAVCTKVLSQNHLTCISPYTWNNEVVQVFIDLDNELSDNYLTSFKSLGYSSPDIEFRYIDQPYLENDGNNFIDYINYDMYVVT